MKKRLSVFLVGCLILIMCTMLIPFMGCDTNASANNNSSGNTENNLEDNSATDLCDADHTFNKNICAVCGYEQKDLSELTETQRSEYSAIFYAMITAYSDDDVLDTYISLIRLQAEIYNESAELVEEAEQIVKEEKESLEEIKNNRNIMSYNPATNQFEYVADAKAVKAQEEVVEQAERDLQSAQRRQEQAALDLTEYITYFDITCYNECLNIIVQQLNDEISNKSLKYAIMIVSLKFESAFTQLDTYQSNNFNTWHNKFIQNVIDITGINYDNAIIEDLSDNK